MKGVKIEWQNIDVFLHVVIHMTLKKENPKRG